MSFHDYIPVLVAIIGTGGISTVLSVLFTRRKNNSEANKTDAEAINIQAESFNSVIKTQQEFNQSMVNALKEVHRLIDSCQHVTTCPARVIQFNNNNKEENK